MAIQTVVELNVSSPQAAVAKAQASAGSLKAKVKSQSGSFVVMVRGSQLKMRLLGGAFIKDTDLPIQGTVEIVDSPNANLRITCREHLVIGTSLGMRDKLQRACTTFAQDLVKLVEG